MKQIIPFKKELLFKTKVSEITSISLEHTLSLKDDDLISGEFYITGDYKMTEGSINREKFQFQLPFDIALDSRYDMSNIIIDIDNFYYEIINNEALQINIDVYVEGEKIEEPIIEEPIIEEEPLLNEIPTIEESIEVLSTPIKEERQQMIDIEIPTQLEELEPTIEIARTPIASLEPNTDTNFNIFENIDNSDTYITYYVYIVKEDDTIDKILNKYNVTKDNIALYNDIEAIKPGTKLIIPSNCNE